MNVNKLRAFSHKRAGQKRDRTFSPNPPSYSLISIISTFLSGFRARKCKKNVACQNRAKQSARRNTHVHLSATAYRSCRYICFYAFDPARGEMRRKRIKINSVGTAAQKRRYATQVCNRLSTQLESGWNPWVKAEADNCYKLFEDAISHYRRHITKLLNDGVHRQTTHHCYMSFAGMLEKWNNRKTPIRYVYQFDRTFCVRFLDYVYLERKSSPSTRNNALAFLRSFSTFLVQHLYLKERPTAGLQKQPSTQ